MTDKAIEAAARALSERSSFALSGDWDAQVEHDQRMYKEAQAAISAYLMQREADGFVMVPVEATKAQLAASIGQDVFSYTPAHYEPDRIYRAMIEARPQVKP